MLYEAIQERGSMVIVPSSAVETMGLGGNAGDRGNGEAGDVKTRKNDRRIPFRLKVIAPAGLLNETQRDGAADDSEAKHLLKRVLNAMLTETAMLFA